MNIVLGLIGIAVGALMVIKTEGLVSAFGKSNWAEQHMGTSGGTRMMYKLIGIIVIVVSVMTALGLLQPIILNTFGSLFGA
jgi:hypothetical protein